MTKRTSPNGTRLDRLDTFVIAGVVTILMTRAFLAVTDYPQIGNDSLHVAHVLWGGAFLTAAFMLVLLSETPNKLFAALFGGIGFGLFIDEVGKFLTKDNDYFYEPAIGIMYITLLVIWFLGRWAIVRVEKTPFLSPAEWPSKKWMRFLILLWCGAQVFLGIALAALLVVHGMGEVSAQFRVTDIGVVAAILYSLLLAVGMWQFYTNKYMKAAHDLRGATLFAIVLVFPFFYLNHPEISSYALAFTLFVMVGLSEVSIVSIVKKLVMK
jgi:hypothetical protein